MRTFASFCASEGGMAGVLLPAPARLSWRRRFPGGWAGGGRRRMGSWGGADMVGGGERLVGDDERGSQTTAFCSLTEGRVKKRSG